MLTGRTGDRPGTLRLYRQVLRGLRTFLRDRCGVLRPGGLTRELAEGFLWSLAEQNVSWSWLASVIALLRNGFDRFGNMEVTVHMVTPRRKWPLPETLHARELRLLFDALPTSPLDPESRGMIVRQMTVLLGRLAMVLRGPPPPDGCFVKARACGQEAPRAAVWLDSRR